ncbi:hypothetical protein MalM25_04210 [Planctomycetes bacterium MalM25]|nr:hypothetical protein MalM25_04210 [Planctomycetes bacterium MalM25]
MEQRRKEIAPVLISGLATAALGLSAAIVIPWPTAQRPDRAEPPRRISGALAWPVAQLPPLTANVPATPETPPFGQSLVSGVELQLSEPVAACELTDWDPFVTDPIMLREIKRPRFAAAAPPRRGYEGQLAIFLPGQPKWRAGDRRPMVITATMRERWSIGPIDMLRVARAAGSAGVRPRSALRGELPRRLQTAWLWVGDWVAKLPPAVEAPKVAAVTPRLVAARLPANKPAVVLKPSPVVVRMPTISEYLAGSRGAGDFPIPTALGEQLDRVAERNRLAPWAWAVAYRLRTLAEAPADDVAAHRSLAALRSAHAEALADADTLGQPADATELRRAAYALSRRVATWRAEQSHVLHVVNNPPSSSDRLAAARWAMSAKGLGLAPGVMLAEPRLASPTPVLRVARRIEEYEQRPTGRLARLLAEDAERLAAIGGAEEQAVATAIQHNYRNANLRVAIAAGLIERLLPQPEPIVAPIRDRIAGSSVRGQSTTKTQLALRLQPDPSAWRLGLDAQGVVTSRTYSRGGPAVLRAQGATSFVAKKLIVLDHTGLRAAPTVAETQSVSQRLVGLATDYDGVPLLGGYVRSTAKSEYGRLRARAKAETRVKVERRVCDTLDERVEPELARFQRRFATGVTQRAQALGLGIQPVEIRTTDTRLIGRVRVANDQQLGAHTPRMRAPRDSWLSVQLHESTLNNALDGLDLAGETLTNAELRERLTTRLQLPTRESSNGEVATLRFSREEPIRFRLEEGRARLTLAIDEIRVRGRRHRNFKVHAYYRPEVIGLTATLVQDGTPDIEGRLRTGSRLHLHGVMGKVLGDNARIPLVRLNDKTPTRLTSALEGLVTNQLVIEDGWLGLAIGPERPADRIAVRVGTYVR